MTKRIAFLMGRYQNVDLHQGYIYLIGKALAMDGVTDFVPVMGTSPVPASRHNPFTFAERKQMFVDSLQTNKADFLVCLAGFLEQFDQYEDTVWSKNLDKLIWDFIDRRQQFAGYEPVLVCSRDSFKSHYSGNIEVVEIEPDTESVTSSEARASILQQPAYVNKSYMIGKLKAINAKYPTVYATVDVAIIKETENGQQVDEILLGRKPREKKFRLVGGFSDPTDASFLAAAKREAKEEVGDIELVNWQHVTSMRIDDWRYRRDVDKIITNLYRCTYSFGQPVASDDLAEVKWVKLSDIKEDDVFPAHWALIQELQKFEERRKKIEYALAHVDMPRASEYGL